MLSDMFIVAVAAIICNFVLDVFAFDVLETKNLVAFTTMNVALCFFTLWVSGAYTKMWRYFKIKDYVSCIIGIFIGISLSSVFAIILECDLTFLLVISNILLSTLGVVLFRILFRNAFLVISSSYSKEKKRTLIVGAGHACEMILNEIKNAKSDPKNPSNQYNIICIVDDDKEKLGKLVHNVQVKGTTYDLKMLSEKEDIDLIIFAIPSCDEDERKRILDLCSDTKLPIKVIPYLSNMIFDDKNTSILNQVKDIKIEDLLGREPITFDKEEIKNLIKGKVCMITGGGGSIGAELTRQISKYEPQQVIIVDIYENNAYEVQQELVMEYGHKLNLVTLIASVRDYNRMNQIFREYKPQIVFHAAAHKHVPLMETSPMEAVKNNVMGTFNVATLSDFYKVEKFVMISTDKAVNPTNIMGATKRCCEMIIQYMSQSNTETEFITTRFGNVLGSNGSVIPLFKKQIENGLPITVTHPDIIRYFMTIPEAVSLVLQAGAMATGGEIFVLDMGAPVKITTLAENLIRMYGKVPYKDVEIKFVGLRPGEKLFEELLMDEEGLKETSNKKIFIGNHIDIEQEEFIAKLQKLKNSAIVNDCEATIEYLSDIVPTYVRDSKNETKNIKHAVAV